jgi:hypothetical protein
MKTQDKTSETGAASSWRDGFITLPDGTTAWIKRSYWQEEYNAFVQSCPTMADAWNRCDRADHLRHMVETAEGAGAFARHVFRHVSAAGEILGPPTDKRDLPAIGELLTVAEADHKTNPCPEHAARVYVFQYFYVYAHTLTTAPNAWCSEATSWQSADTLLGKDSALAIKRFIKNPFTTEANI